MAQSKVRTLGMDERSGGEVTISVPRMLLPTDRWTENAADVTREYRVHIEAKMVEIREFLKQHTAAASILSKKIQNGRLKNPHFPAPPILNIFL
jgi:hypothetical protein